MGEIMSYEERQQSLMAFLKAKSNIIKALVPRHQDARRLAMVVHQSVQRTPALLDCSFDSLVGSILECFRLGLEPGGIGGEAYLIPLKDRGVLKANLWMGYKGLCRLAYNSGQVGYISAEPVYEGDEFDYELGSEPFVKHKPGDGPRTDDKITHFYAILHLRDARPVFKVMTNAEVLKIKGRSRASSNGPWVTDYPAMGCKTVIKRALRTAPLSQELQQAIGFDDLAEVGKDQSVEKVWDVPVEVVGGDPAVPSPEFVKFIRSLRSQWMKKMDATYTDFAGLAADVLGPDRAPGEWEDKATRDEEEPKWLLAIGKDGCKAVADRLKKTLGMED